MPRFQRSASAKTGAGTLPRNKQEGEVTW